MPRQCASHCRCRLPGPASKRSSWQQSNVACRQRTPPEGSGGVSGRAQCPQPPPALVNTARSALARSTGLWLRSACSGSVLVCRRGWWGRSSPASSGTACGPAPGGGRVYRALHSPCGPAAHIVLALALPWCESTPRACARCFTFPLLNLLGWLKAACGAAFSL